MYKRQEDGQDFEEPGVIIYDIDQEYIGQVRDTSPRVNKQIQKDFPKAKTLCLLYTSIYPSKILNGIAKAVSKRSNMILITPDAQQIQQAYDQWGPIMDLSLIHI